MTTERVAGRWEAIGGREGGTVSALAFSPAYPRDKTVFAATLAGVHRSVDAGQSWHSASQGLPNPFVDAIAISPTFDQDRTVFVGGRSAGVSRSTDGGETWQALSFWSQLPPSIAALAISPSYQEDGIVFAGSEDGLVYRTNNRGRTWNASATGLTGGAVLSLAITPHFAGGGSLLAATAAGLYRSDDGGEHWSPSGLSEQICQVVLYSSTYEMDGIVLVGTETGGVFRSDDDGQTWQAVSTGLTDLCVNALAVSPTYMMDGVALAATASGVYRTDDATQTWQQVGETGATLCLAVLPRAALSVIDIGSMETDPTAIYRTVLAGTAHFGIFRSADAGQTWLAASEGLHARLLVGLTLSPSFATDQTLFVCGLEEGIHRSDDGGVTWQPASGALPSLEVAGLAISPNFATDQVIVAATAAGVAVSRDRGDVWLASGGPVPTQAVALAPTFNQLGPLLAAGADGSLHLSPDAGLTWRMLEPPFIGEEVAMVAFSPSYAEDQSLFVATSRRPVGGQAGQASVWFSSDNGATWQSLLVERDETRWLSLAVPETFADDHAFYIGLSDRVLRPMRRSVETRIGSGSRRPIWIGERPGGSRTTVVGLALSPTYRFDQTLFAATSTGVYVSRNAGLGWKLLAEGMIDRSIVAVALSPTYADDGVVFAASLGGTIWRLVDTRTR